MDKLGLKDKIEVVLKREEGPAEDEISLREIIEAIIRGKMVILKTVVVSLLLLALFLSLTNPNKNFDGIARTVISFNFEGIEKGLDPHGKRFDINKLRAPVVLAKAVELMELDRYGMTVDDLRDNLQITPIVEGNIVEKTIERIEADKENIATYEDFTYYPNRFVISLNLPEKFNLGRQKGRETLDQVIDAYIEHFYDTYSDREALTSVIGKIDYHEYDYPEIILIMRNQINIMESYLSAKKREAPNFRSLETGLTFQDVVEGISLIDSLDLNRMGSLIGSYRLSKDRESLIRSLEYRIKSYNLSRQKKEDESRLAAELLDKFEKERSVVFMGGVGTPEGMIETEKTNPLYDELVVRSLDTGVSAVFTLHDIEYLQREIEIFSEEDNIPMEVKRQAENELLEMIDRTDQKLGDWINLTNRTVNEYFENIYFQRAVMKLTPVEIYNPVFEKLSLKLAIGLVLGLMGGVFIAIFSAYWQGSANSNTGKESEGA